MNINNQKIDSIALHSAQAPFYKYRIPYLEEWFKKLVETLDLDRESILLDICCGLGELSKGLADKVGHIYAVDGSEAMLARAYQAKNISYALCDLNFVDYAPPRKVDCILIGRAVHWLHADRLQHLISSSLTERGVVLVCSTQVLPVGEWFGIYKKVLSSYMTYIKTGKRFDHSGKETMEKIGFSQKFTIEASSIQTFDLDYLLNSTLATTYGDDLENLLQHLDKFRAELATNIGSVIVNQPLSWKVLTWGILYAKTQSH